MTTLRTRIEGLISTYNNKAPCALCEMENKDSNRIFIGLRTIPDGFYVYTLQKYFAVKSVTAERSGPNKGLDDIINRRITFSVECLYDNGIHTSYRAQPSELKKVNGAFVPLDIVKQDEFLKKLFETDEPVKPYQKNFKQRINELGMDETELFEGLNSDTEETKQHEFDNENTLDDEFE